MSKILFVISEYEPFQSSGINRLKYFKEYLENEGHFVVILTTSCSAQGIISTKKYGHDKHIYRAYSLGLRQRKMLSSRRLPIYPKIALEGKYASWKYFAIRKGLDLIQKFGIDCIFTSFPDFSSIKVAAELSIKSKRKLIIDFRDPPYWIYEPIVNDKKTEYCKKIISNAISLSDNLIFATSDSKESMTQHYGFKNYSIIGNGYDENILSSLPPTIHREDGFIEIVHIGSFYAKGRDINRIIRVLEKSSDKIKCKHNKKIKLRLVGDKPERATLQLIDSVSTIVIDVEKPVTPIEALRISKQADVLLLLQGSLFDRQIPAKLYEYLALNRPIWAIVGKDGATHQLLKKYECNVVLADYNNEENIEESMEAMFELKAKSILCEELSRKFQSKPLGELFIKT